MYSLSKNFESDILKISKDLFLNVSTIIVDILTEICVQNKKIMVVDNIVIANENISKGTVFLTFRGNLLKDETFIVNKISHNKNGNIVLIIKHDDIYSKKIIKKDTNTYYLMANEDIKKGTIISFIKQFKET
jgi:hypothetical protein